MSFFSRSRDENARYLTLGTHCREVAREQARIAGIDIGLAPLQIMRECPLPGNVDGENYWLLADYLLAEYPTELGLLIASTFHGVKQHVGFDPYGKIMIGAQFVDRKAGTGVMARFSFLQSHPKLHEFMSEKDCPERTEKAVDFLAAAMFQFPSIDHAKSVYPKVIVVPEMTPPVVRRLSEIDGAIAKYLLG